MRTSDILAYFPVSQDEDVINGNSDGNLSERAFQDFADECRYEITMMRDQYDLLVGLSKKQLVPYQLELLFRDNEVFPQYPGPLYLVGNDSNKLLKLNNLTFKAVALDKEWVSLRANNDALSQGRCGLLAFQGRALMKEIYKLIEMERVEDCIDGFLARQCELLAIVELADKSETLEGGKIVDRIGSDSADIDLSDNEGSVNDIASVDSSARSTEIEGSIDSNDIIDSNESAESVDSNQPGKRRSYSI